MTTNRRRVRRTATLATTAAAVALTAGLLTACDPTDTADTSGASRVSDSLNCLRNWNTVSDSLKAISDYNKSILNGDTHPDAGKIDATAEKLKNVCAS
ncbi:hypothetical protein [Streptomyces prunicolor]|uniref:Secreted protein n=1 Tax=Streptomyces prunicolor TaxID=67348 RepID=A0ABU4FCH8_9ACTN|nr:hypothetical protein [Streptomyces prunicolor]MDV7218297.1 hypothetical protein [Streptomyces prunicolor]